MRKAPGARMTRSRLYVGLVYLAIAGISLLHYLAPVHAHPVHDILRRLYYLPIILAAFLNGLWGGLVAALVVCAAYAPHAFGRISMDPATPTQKILEMLLYVAVGTLTGALVSRLHSTQRQLEGSAASLKTSLDRLEQTEQRLITEARLAAVGRLSAGLAHEIRNPLASIKGSAELLADDFPSGHPKHRLLQVLMDESVRLNQVLTRFLAFARPRPLDRREFEIASEIEDVFSLLRGRGEGQDIRLELRAEDPGLRIWGDREQLRQIFLNVLLNACQIAGAGGSVLVECVRRGGVCLIRVRDSGPGFSREALENAFTPFYSSRDQGTGLGLAISHRIAESHGGHIRVRNHPEGGALVEIELPAETLQVGESRIAPGTPRDANEENRNV